MIKDDLIQKVISDLLFLPLDMETPPKSIVEYLETLQMDKLYPDEYRNCFHVPVMHDINESKTFEWAPWAYQMPELIEWCEDVLIPITGKSRIMICTTPSGQEMSPHIDCSPDMFETLQHKFRYVLQGNVEDLEFIVQGGSIKPSPIDKPYVMSGRWPHKMNNTSDKTKFTLSLGAPWDGSIYDDRYVDLITKSYLKYDQYWLSYQNVDLPDDWQTMFESSYNYEEKAKDVNYE